MEAGDDVKMRTIRQRMNETRLRNKLVITYFVASIIPIIVISFTIYQFSAENVEDASQEFVSLYISQATTNLDNFLERHNQTTQSVLLERDIMSILGDKRADSMEDIIKNKRIIQRYFGRTTTNYPEIETIFLIDVNGDIYDYTKDADKVNIEILRQQEWYKNIRPAEHSMFVTAVHDRSYYGINQEGAAFTVGRVLWNFNGSYAGMILFDMNPSHLIQLSKDFLSIGNRYDIALIITDKEDRFIYHSDAATGKRDWKDLIGETYGSPTDKQNDTMVLSKETIGGRFLLSMEIPLHKLLSRINNIKEVTIWVIIGCLLFIIMISVVFSYKITKPIQDLRRSMKQVELGQYSSLIHLPPGSDEITSLIKSYNNMIQKIKELIEDVFMAGMKRKQAQLVALQSQINPHMLYNTLESIRMKAVVKEQDEIAEMIKILAKMFKYSLRKEGEANLIRNEVEYAANFIFLQNIRYDHRFTLEVALSERVLHSTIIPMIFQPIVENSIKHGFRDYNTYLHIKIEEVSIENNDVLIRIIDNGTTLSKERAEEINHLLQRVNNNVPHLDVMEQEIDSGIGLCNIAERIKLHYGEQYYLKLTSHDNQGAIVEMLIPLL